MKDFNSSNLNLENKIIQKGVLDLKIFWQYINEKYFRTNENDSWELFSKLKYFFLQKCRTEFIRKKRRERPICSGKIYRRNTASRFKTW